MPDPRSIIWFTNWPSSIMPRKSPPEKLLSLSVLFPRTLRTHRAENCSLHKRGGFDRDREISAIQNWGRRGRHPLDSFAIRHYRQTPLAYRRETADAAHCFQDFYPRRKSHFRPRDWEQPLEARGNWRRSHSLWSVRQRASTTENEGRSRHSQNGKALGYRAGR